MKPRHVRRLAVALAVGGALLLAASLLVGILDNGLGGNKDHREDRDEDRDDPGGFHRFQEELVRRREAEEEERLRRQDEDGVIRVSENETAGFIRAASRWNELRLQRVQQVCARHNLGLFRSSSATPRYKLPPTPQYAVFYYDRPHKMAWCPLYKAGSSSWLYNLCLLGGYSERELRHSKEQLSTLARKAFPELEYPEAEEALGSSRKILVVRHPLARLLSAYRDKLENRVAGAEHGTAHFYAKYGRRIVERYRRGGASVRTSALLKPEHVVRDVADVKDTGKQPPADDEPTFKEFVQYLIDVDLASYADDHWIPYYLFCTPCLLNYDIVAKVETYLEDQVYMIRALGLQDSIRPRWRHRTAPSALLGEEGGKEGEEGLPMTASSTASTASRRDAADRQRAVARAYFGQVSERELRALHDKYRLDFELFDYALEDYLPFVSAT